jgi:hypothetical protein
VLTFSPLASRRTWRTRSFLSLLGFLTVLVLAAALHVIGKIKSALADEAQDPWHGAIGDAPPLGNIEERH